MSSSLPLIPERETDADAWDRQAPERDGRESLWGQLPDAIAPLLDGGTLDHVYGQLFRPDTWVDGVPILGRRATRVLGAFDRSLPALTEAVKSADGSTKCILTTTDGHRIEAVHMPRDVKNPRVTYCISSQVGCAMGCTFCATGSMGIIRNLTAGEIVGQVLTLMTTLGPQRGQDVSLVFMGMGEPLHNLRHVHQAIGVLTQVHGLGIAARRITVSTSGIVSKIDALAKLSPRPRLAISVNATTDEQRQKTMPVARRWNLDALKAALIRFGATKKDALFLEYVLLANENDSVEDAERLASFASGLHAKINVIPMNEHAQSAHLRPSEARQKAFVEVLAQRGHRVLVRHSRGSDIGGACGQLVQTARPAATTGA